MEYLKNGAVAYERGLTDSNPILRTGFGTLNPSQSAKGPSVLEKKLESLESLGNVCICIYLYETICVSIHIYIYFMHEKIYMYMHVKFPFNTRVFQSFWDHSMIKTTIYKA